MALPFVELVDETALYFEEPSCAFDCAESLLPRPKARLSRLKDESSVMASVTLMIMNRFVSQETNNGAERSSRG